ncbi:DUF962 domain-containing protein [Arenimonas fontis]|uniref:DUF962 domain-containing protein n=1 Tax=Arenimonas fontis TaxID=2608255 RepID=A0A5B2ZAQ1_9GAMM|nr:Mpo1-like protein [Arenimonas fontis]KAA2285025.1 DUF962 domain-containing protein [Arenimonas fontis]
MNATPELAETPDPRRPIDRYLHSYAGDHQHPTNQAIHLVCVPAIVWTVTALLWTVPVPEALLRPGAWMALAMFAAWLWYWRLSRRLALGALVVFLAFGFLNRFLYDSLGNAGLFWLALGVFVIAWIGQFIGHRIEGRRPSFFTDLVYLLIGPLWTLSKLYKRLGWRW